ncbi:MAG TPA: diguanylate cyclase [Steroidobacteraceae bacterium]|nr:diguanylate cyclase [Steroidobacteraceae bacterium]
MNASTDDWRNKYLDSMRTLESEEQRFRATETILKRLAGRLCIACLGLSSRLDQEVKKLQGILRREDVKADELEKLFAPLADAVISLDEKSTASAAAQTVIVKEAASSMPVTNDAQIRAALAALLVELKRDASLAKAAQTLDDQLAEPLTVERLSPMLVSLTEMVAQRIQRIERAREEAEALLAQMVTQLDEISRFVADHHQNQHQARASSDSLNAQLTGEFKAISDSVEAGSDLQQIRSQVRQRLDTIGRHLQEFRQREEQRAEAMHARNEQMQKRVAELEAEAQKLQTQLHAEQQVSLLDGLTKLPNRLAYDKRMEEEMQRSKRFGQAVCVAVWDVDHFKKVNDTYGHRAGDRVLCNVADYLKSHARSTDFIARYGGEEFVMILVGTQIDNAMALLEKIRVSIAKLGFHYRGQPVPITISCGVSELKQNDSAESVFERADKALYQAKKQGRNRCLKG